MKLPNFLVIGAQKSGTSWLHRYLASRSDVFVSDTKELMFFSSKSRFNTLGFDWYCSKFAAAGDAAAVGEITPDYLWVSGEPQVWMPASGFRVGTPERVREFLGQDIRIIAILRNPLDRALSAFLHHRNLKRIPLQDTIEAHLTFTGIGHMGFYAAHLSRWAEVFPLENFLVHTYENIFGAPQSRAEILRFIGAEPDTDDEFVNVRVHVGKGFTRDADGARDSEGNRIATASGIASMREAYRPDVFRLGSEWKVDVSCWTPDFPGR